MNRDLRRRVVCLTTQKVLFNGSLAAFDIWMKTLGLTAMQSWRGDFIIQSKNRMDPRDEWSPDLPLESGHPLHPPSRAFLVSSMGTETVYVPEVVSSETLRRLAMNEEISDKRSRRRRIVTHS